MVHVHLLESQEIITVNKISVAVVKQKAWFGFVASYKAVSK